ncbi:hypothetical protein SLS62_003917 [Diatrype stigma]|uniref:Uncharacterized protein n=1 Tax=Diatrype stigma TaxID=117547 RepID=A0AAN9YQY6_9PEZI
MDMYYRGIVKQLDRMYVNGHVRRSRLPGYVFYFNAQNPQWFPPYFVWKINHEDGGRHVVLEPHRVFRHHLGSIY